MNLRLCKWTGLAGNAVDCRTISKVVLTAVLIVGLGAWCAGDEPESIVQPEFTVAAPVAQPGVGLDEPVLRYLPDDCRVFGQLTVAPILDSEFVRNLSYNGTDPRQVCNLAIQPLGLEVDDIERVFFGARYFNDSSLSQFVAIVYCKKAVDLTKAAAAIGSWKEMQVDGHTVWHADGDGALGLCAVEDQTMLFGEVNTLRTVLQRGKPAKLPETRQTSWQVDRSSSALSISVLRNDKDSWIAPSLIPVAGDALKGLDAVGLEVKFGRQLEVNISALCGDEEFADQLNKIVMGLCAYLKLHQPEDQIPPQLRELVDTIVCDCQGRVVTAQLTIPNELVQLAAFGTPQMPGLAYGFGPQCNSASLGPYLSNSATQPCSPTSGSPPLPWSGSSASSPPCAIVPGQVPNPLCPPPATTSLPPSAYPSASPSPYASPPVGVPVYAPPSSTPVTSGRGIAPRLPTLAVADVVRLVAAGVDNEVIARHLRKHHLETILTVDDLILLTEQEVSSEIITALQELPVSPKPRTPKAVPAAIPNKIPPPSSRSANRTGVPHPYAPAPGSGIGYPSTMPTYAPSPVKVK